MTTITFAAFYQHVSNPIKWYHRILWSLLLTKLYNGENDWEEIMPTLDPAYNGAIHTPGNCSPARGFLGRNLIVPQEANLPRFQKQQRIDPSSLEEQMDQVYENMRQQEEVRIRRKFQSYSNKCEDIQP